MKRDLAEAQMPEQAFNIARSSEILSKSLLDAAEAQTVQKYAQAFSDKMLELNLGYRAFWELSTDDATQQQHRQQTLRKHVAIADEGALRAYNGFIKQSMRLLITKSLPTKDFIAAQDIADTFLHSSASVSELRNATTAKDVVRAASNVRDAIRTVEGSQAKIMLRVYADNFEREMKAVDGNFALLSQSRKK